MKTDITRDSTSDIALRAFDPDRDLPAVAEMICDVNGHVGLHWFPTVESLRNEWSPSEMHHPHFDSQGRDTRRPGSSARSATRGGSGRPLRKPFEG